MTVLVFPTAKGKFKDLVLTKDSKYLVYEVCAEVKGQTVIQFSPTVWDPGMKLRSSGLAALYLLSHFTSPTQNILKQQKDKISVSKQYRFTHCKPTGLYLAMEQWVGTAVCLHSQLLSSVLLLLALLPSLPKCWDCRLICC